MFRTINRRPRQRAQVDGALPKWPNDVADGFSRGTASGGEKGVATL
jgi:hypothetical protein